MNCRGMKSVLVVSGVPHSAGMWMAFQSRAQPMEPVKPAEASEVQAYSVEARAGFQSDGVSLLGWACIS